MLTATFGFFLIQIFQYMEISPCEMKELWVITGSGLWVDWERPEGVWLSSSHWLRGWWMTGGKTEQRGKWLANIQRELYFFPADEGEFYVTKLLIFIFSSVMSKSMGAWEPVWPTAGQARREPDGRQGFFPSYILLRCSQYYKKIFLDLGPLICKSL